MNKHFGQLLHLLCLFGASQCYAVSTSSRGTGEVLLYPYYTVNHQQTLVSVVNAAAHAKALKVRFREGYDGRSVADFNLYLGPHDTWVGAVFDLSPDGTGGAAIATNDTSCTVPKFPASASGLPVLVFSANNYTSGSYGAPAGTDHGPTAISRTREGFFEVIEMGEVVDQAGGHLTKEAITPSGTTPPRAPPHCDQVIGAWEAGGYWQVTPTIDLLPPAGEIYGSAAIVDVANGTVYAYEVTTLDGYSDVVQHTSPGNGVPNLSTAVTDSTAGTATAFVPIGGKVVVATYPAGRGIDAVSAVLMASRWENEFNTEATLGASTDWLMTFPTKQFYVDPGIVGTAADLHMPFTETFDAASCDGVNPTFFDRSGLPTLTCGVQCGPPFPATCLQTNVLTINNSTVDGPSDAIGSNLVSYYLQVGVNEGNLQLEPPTLATLRPSNEGIVFNGLPAIGFVVTNFVNANVTQGVLANYSALYPHRTQVTCTPHGQNGC